MWTRAKYYSIFILGELREHYGIDVSKEIQWTTEQIIEKYKPDKIILSGSAARVGWVVIESMGERRLMLEQICRQFGVAILYAFGSQARRVQDWLYERAENLALTTDVDLGAKTRRGLKWSIAEKISLTIALEGLFGCQRVDLVPIAEADPFLAAQIVRGERLFALDEYEADEYELYILRRAGDLAPLERDRMTLVLGGTE